MRVVALLALSLVGCLPKKARLAPPEPAWTWAPDEVALVEAPREDFDLVTRGQAVLRRRARSVPDLLDLSAVAARMAETMHRADGVGIAGPQVGLGARVAVLMLGYRTDQPHEIVARNPVVLERSDDVVDSWEGCLSVPDKGGLVRRSRWVKVAYTDQQGQRVLTEAEGPDAILWQHEIDHLDGVLYVDRLVGELMSADEMRERRAAAAEPASGAEEPASAPVEEPPGD